MDRNQRDPRVALGGRHRERGPRRFTYGWREIAALAGCSEKTAQNYASQGRFDPRSLASVVAFLEQRRRRPTSGA